MGKNKDKGKDKDKSNRNEDERPGRKELMQRVEALEAENEALRARLDRIAEIAAAPTSSMQAPGMETRAVIVDGQST